MSAVQMGAQTSAACLGSLRGELPLSLRRSPLVRTRSPIPAAQRLPSPELHTGVPYVSRPASRAPPTSTQSPIHATAAADWRHAVLELQTELHSSYRLPLRRPSSSYRLRSALGCPTLIGLPHSYRAFFAR